MHGRRETMDGQDQQSKGVDLSVLPANGAAFRIGRSSDNDLVLDDLLASRSHAQIVVAGEGQFELTDLGSANGTFVNGRRVESQLLHDQDFVSFGGTRFRLAGAWLEPSLEEAGVAFAAVGVSVTAGEATLVRNVSFPLRLGSLTAIVGPSGAGKSSLLGALTGMRSTAAGTVYFAGRDLHAEYAELRHRVGFVPQDDIVHPELTVYESIEFGAALRFAPDVSAAERRARVEEVMTELELSHRRSVQVKRLSGGERKRVSVALELLTRPTLLFLDEPTSGLDPGLERNLMELLRRLADGGRVVIVVTHTVDSVHMCDRILFLAPGGRVAYFAPPNLAPSYFGRGDYQEIFQDLTDGDPETFRERFEQDELARLYVAEPLIGLEPKQGQPGKHSGREVQQQPWMRQFLMLVGRNLRVLAADRASVITTVLAGPLLGLLALWRLPGDELSKLPETQVRLVSQASLTLFVVMLSMTLLGLSNGIREISKEARILERELAVGLSPSAYVGSKALVLGGITILQAIVLVPIALANQGGPNEAVALGWPLGEVIVAAALAGLAALAVAMLVSGALKSTAAATGALPMILAFQVLFGSAGVFPDANNRPLLRELTYASSTGWGFAAAASTSDLNELQRSNNVAAKIRVVDLTNPQQAVNALYDPTLGDHTFDHTARRWWTAIGALGALTTIGFVGAGLAVRRARVA